MDTWTLTTERYGTTENRTVNLFIDIRDFKDKAGFAWLLMAANPQLSVRELQEVLSNVGAEHERPVGWLSRRRWMFHGKGSAGRKTDVAKAQKARRIMDANPNASARQLAAMFRHAGLGLSREYARRHRVGDT
ncbi:MAG: hypothetical protein ACLPH3_05875 [Terracidiphilus sp.]